MWTFVESIIDAAESELAREGETMHSMAGVEYVEDEFGELIPARQLTNDEIIALSIEKLGDDGRMYVAFNTSPDGEMGFVETAARYGLADEASSVIKEAKGATM